MTTVISFTNQLKTMYPNLTKTEKKCASYILEHLDTIGNLTLAQISKEAGVGEATIMRFIYKLGYENIAQFKVAIIKENIENQKSDENEKDVEFCINRVARLMRDSVMANEIKDIEKVANLINQVSHVYFFGNGTSGFAAEVGAYRFFRAGVSCEVVTDVHMMLMKAALIKEDTLVIAVSLSGDNSDIIQAVKLAKKNNCKIVTITGRQMSLLSQYSDVSLFHVPVSLSDQSYYGGILGIIIQEFLIEIIFETYSQLNPDKIDEAQQITTISTNLHHIALHSKEDE